MKSFHFITAATTLWVVITVPPQAAAQSPTSDPLLPGRLLSSSCFQCHSAGGFDNLAGKSSTEIVSEMREMKARIRPEGIMDLIARGYTDQQIRDLALYLASIPKSTSTQSESDDD